MQNNNKRGGQIYAVLTIMVLIMTTIICFIPILSIGVFKLIPIKRWQDLCTKGVDVVASFWCSINNFYVNNTQSIQWNISGFPPLNPKEWNLVIANHQTWLDIVILQRLFNRKIPIMKFFIKDQLKWVPLLGFAWWAMGCPFMKRYSKEYLAKNPHKKGQDLQATLKAMENFKRMPASIMNFIEGTRFTKEKHQKQQSQFEHLLQPKAGGLSYILSSMGKQLHSILDVTIVYPKQYSLWDFLCRRMDFITINIRQLAIPKEFQDLKLIEDQQIMADFKHWLNNQWATKDQLITTLK